MALTLDQLNQASLDDATLMLAGLYEHSPWIARAALAGRPFGSLAQLKHAMVQVLASAGVESQLALIRAHPELAGKAMVSKSLTAESTNEQSKAGLTHCTPDEFEKIQSLNAAYNARFGFPFILAVRGPRGTGLSKAEIIATFARRLHGHPDFERQECIRNIHRIAEIRLNDLFGFTPELGNRVWDWQEALAQHADAGYAEQGQLTVTYLTDAHRACAQRISMDMLQAGCDTVHIDAVGNVVGRYKKESDLRNTDEGQGPVSSRTLLTGSHYDTVRNGGKYDGRLGIYVPLACVQALSSAGKRLPFDLEIVAFAEEEGQRYKATFLGSGALTGDFNPAWLDQVDADGISMRAAMQHAGLSVDDIPSLKRNANDYQGFVEVHIEQGPVLNELDIPLGIVTSINASVRYVGEVLGMASHAGTTPMGRRRDAAAAVAELILYVEQRAAQDSDLVGTVGHAAGSQRLNQRGARALPVFAGPARAERRAARPAGRRRGAGSTRDLRTPSHTPGPGGNHACQRRTQRAGVAGPLGERRAGAGRAPAPHAQWRGPRRDEAARDHATGHAVCARPELRHQPQPAGIHHQRRHAIGRRRLYASAQRSRADHCGLVRPALFPSRRPP
jgi:N-carbamoyl-L-amino-acid hydrolase